MSESSRVLSVSQIASLLTKLTPDFWIDMIDVASTDSTYGLPATASHKCFIRDGTALEVVVDLDI